MTPDAVLKCPVCGSTTGLNGKPFHNSRALGGHIGRAHTHMLKTHLTPELHFTGKPTVNVSSASATVAGNGVTPAIRRCSTRAFSGRRFTRLSSGSIWSPNSRTKATPESSGAGLVEENSPRRSVRTRPSKVHSVE